MCSHPRAPEKVVRVCLGRIGHTRLNDLQALRKLRYHLIYGQRLLILLLSG